MRERGDVEMLYEGGVVGGEQVVRDEGCRGE